jgi:hypothetical protein
MSFEFLPKYPDTHYLFIYKISSLDTKAVMPQLMVKFKS